MRRRSRLPTDPLSLVVGSGARSRLLAAMVGLTAGDERALRSWRFSWLSCSPTKQANRRTVPADAAQAGISPRLTRE